MIVVDDSVAAKRFLAEEDKPHANDLRDGTQKLVAPALIRADVHAAITLAFCTVEAPAAEVRQDCRDWSGMIDEGLITLLPFEADEPRAITLALRLKHPYQDCLYHVRGGGPELGLAGLTPLRVTKPSGEALGLRASQGRRPAQPDRGSSGSLPQSLRKPG